MEDPAIFIVTQGGLQPTVNITGEAPVASGSQHVSELSLPPTAAVHSHLGKPGDSGGRRKRPRSATPRRRASPPQRVRNRLTREEQYDERSEDGTFRSNRRGVPLCPDFQEGLCFGFSCKDKKSHQCRICLSQTHGAADHGKTPPPRQPKGAKGGGRNGKSKGKGRRWY